MGRHSLPDRYDTGATDPRRRTRGRTVAIATALVLTVAAGTAVAVRGDLLPIGGSCADDAVRLDVVAAPDVAPALREAAGLARDDEITSDGHCIDVRVTGREPYEVADELRTAEKTPDYDVWIPDSDLWVQRAGLGARHSRVTSAGNIASSPVGVAMLPSAAKSLGWPEKTYAWPELTGAAMKSGKLRLGAADPARSATGLLALAKLGQAAKKSGPKGGTQAAALAKSLSARTTDSTAQLLDTLPRGSSGTEKGEPHRNQALILSEQAAYAHNRSATPTGGLDLFYPKDGSPRLDYPYALVQEDSMSTDQSRAALRFMTLFSDAEGRGILHRHGFRTESGEPADRVVSGAGGRTPQPYADEAGEAPSDKELQEALGMWTITVQSARLTTVVDASDSMGALVPGRGQSRMDVTKSSLIQALSQFTDEDEIGLWEFATKLDGAKDYRKLEPTKRLGGRAGGSTHREELTRAFGGLQPVPGGATGLYDTTLAAYKEARASYARGRFNALVVLTDGVNEDPGSISRSALVARLEHLADPERPVPIIAIAVGPDADRDEVEQIAEATGGSGHQVDDPAQIHTVILKAIMEAGSRS